MVTSPSPAQRPATILVVDDDRIACALHRSLLAKHYDVITASNGEEALSICEKQMPDLLLLDAEMPNLNGYDTCRLLRKKTKTPIIFATANRSIEEHMQAYDAGGSDLITKPVNAEILLRKVNVAIEQYRQTQRIEREKAELSRMAMGFLSNAGQNGTLLNFMRTSLRCSVYRDLAEQLLAATSSLNLECVIRIRHDNTQTALSHAGEPSPLELSILDHASEMGRIFQFKRRLVVNYDRVTILVSNMPSETECTQSGVIRDNIAILAETAEALAENVDLRRESARQAERLQVALGSAEYALKSLGEKQRNMMGDVRILLQQFVDDIEKSYAWLNTTTEQEANINHLMERSVHQILDRLVKGGDFENSFGDVMNALNTGYNKSNDAIELF